MKVILFILGFSWCMKIIHYMQQQLIGISQYHSHKNSIHSIMNPCITDNTNAPY